MTPRQRPKDDVGYFRARALEERVAAGGAASSEARTCHDELAMMYRFRAAMLSRAPESWADGLDQLEIEEA